MQKNLIIFFGILLLFLSCDDPVTADFEIINNTGIKIDSLVIEPNINEKGKYISLMPAEKVEYKADMTTIAQIDGPYFISFNSNTEKRTQMFGYYTNGYPQEKITKIKIEKDTILINQIYGEY